MNNNRQPSLEDIDINSLDFYMRVQDEIESDMARLKKSIEIIRNLRLTAAEMEVETAALHHAKLFQNIEELKLLVDSNCSLHRNEDDRDVENSIAPKSA